VRKKYINVYTQIGTSAPSIIITSLAPHNEPRPYSGGGDGNGVDFPSVHCALYVPWLRYPLQCTYFVYVRENRGKSHRGPTRKPVRCSLRETTRNNNYNRGMPYARTFTGNNTMIVITIMCCTYSCLFVRPKTYTIRILRRCSHACSFSPQWRSLQSCLIRCCFLNVQTVNNRILECICHSKNKAYVYYVYNYRYTAAATTALIKRLC